MWQYLTSLFKSDAQLEYETWLAFANDFMTRVATNGNHIGICLKLNNLSLKTNVKNNMERRLRHYMDNHNISVYDNIWYCDTLGSIRRARLCLKFAYLTLKEI